MFASDLSCWASSSGEAADSWVGVGGKTGVVIMMHSSLDGNQSIPTFFLSDFLHVPCRLLPLANSLVHLPTSGGYTGGYGLILKDLRASQTKVIH